MEFSKKSVGKCGDSCFIKQFTLSWSPHLKDVDLQEQISNARSLLEFIALICDAEERSLYNVYELGHVVFKALLFLSQNDMDNMIQSLQYLLEDLQTCVVINLKLSKVSLHIQNAKSFQIVLIIALSHILRKFCKANSSDVILLQLIRCILKSLNWVVTSPLCICCVNVLHTLVKRTGTHVTTCDMEIIHHMYLFLKAVHHKQATKCADEILGLVIKQMKSKDKLILFKKISLVVWWNKGECAIAIHLINYWPRTVALDTFIRSMTTRLAVMLLENVTDHSIKLLRIILHHISLEIWQDVFIPNVIIVVATFCENEWDLISKTMSQCVKVAVHRFKSQMYIAINPNLMFSNYSAIVLYHSIEKDCLQIDHYREDIVKLLHSSNVTMRYYAMKTVCNFNRKSSQITDWHICCIKYYLESTSLSCDNLYTKELHYFFSHMCVQANHILLSEQLPKYFTEFINWLYTFICMALTSHSSRRIKIGAQLFTLLQNTIVLNDKKTKYKIEDSTLFFTHLVKTNQWLYTSDKFYENILNSWLSSKKVYPELYNLVENQPDSLKRNLLTSTNNLFEKRIDKESIIKANYCMVYSLQVLLPDEKYLLVTKIVNRWRAVILSLSDTAQIDVTIAALSYGLTLCITALLQRNELNDDYLQIFHECLLFGRSLLRKDSTHNVLIVKNTEQCFVAIMDVLCLILKKVPDEAMLKCFFEFLAEVIDQCSGKSVTCALVSALYTVCGDMFESSVNFQIVIIRYLDSVLNSMYYTSEVKITKLRKNPEHRLVIHSIISAEKRPSHSNLHHSINFMLDILDNSYPRHHVKESALHTLEILISDSNLHSETFPYITRIAIRAIEGFCSGYWNVKNASIQVLQALMNRLLGQKNGLTHQRRYAIDDLVLLYPDFLLYCIKQLYGKIDEANCDTIIAILGLLSESYYSSYHIYMDENVAYVHDSLLKALTHLICTNKNVGYFAANAYAALYPSTFVPDIICDIITWLKLTFRYIDKNVFASLMSLLGTFHKTFYEFHHNSILKYKIDRAFSDLQLFLKEFNQYEMSLYNFLGIKSNSYDEIIQKTIVILSSEDHFENRIWLNNNLGRVLNNIDIKAYPSFLKQVFNFPATTATLKQYIDSVVTRYGELVENSLTSVLLPILLHCFIHVNNTNRFLLIIFSQIILSLLSSSYYYSCSETLILKLRRYCVTADRNVYKLAVYVAMLSHCSSYVENTSILHEIAILYRRSAVQCDIELQMLLSSTLVYLYNCVDTSLRSLVFESSFILLFIPECSLEVGRFLVYLFQAPYCDVLTVLESFLSAYNLNKCLESFKKTCTFLNNIKLFVSLLSDEFEDCGMFYMRQNAEICSHKQFILKLLHEQIEITTCF